MSISLLDSTATQAQPGAQLGEDFPIICESCLGPNPYVRMLKSERGSACKISGHPFTAFRWQGEHKRWKETIVSPEAARDKNCCQSCLNDLEYNVPFHVRDHVMEALGADRAPQSDVSSQYHWANKRQKLHDGEDEGMNTYDKLKNNVERLRAYAALDPGPIVLPRRDAPMTPEEQEKMRQKRQHEQRAPEDQSITSLYVGGVPPSATKRDLFPYFLAYGEVKDISFEGQKLCAIVTYHRRSDAEAACKAFRGQITIKGTRSRVMWARRKGKAATAVGPRSEHAYYGEGAIAPPGVASVPLTSGIGSLPPGVNITVATYPSMRPSNCGARPDRE